LFGRIDHVGVAVDDLDQAVALYSQRFGMAVEHRETLEDQGVEAVLLEVGESHVELLRPLGADTAVGRFLDRNGPGLHHVAYGTDDIQSALEGGGGGARRRTSADRRRAANGDAKQPGGLPAPEVDRRGTHRARGGSPLMTEESRRIDIGFQGGQVLPARVKQNSYDGLHKALGDERSERWFELETVDSKISVDLSQVVYVRIDTEAQHVGF
jgi:methylmalonyl-CoA/ethylmalonyl-CoA epimerase